MEHAPARVVLGTVFVLFIIGPVLIGVLGAFKNRTEGPGSQQTPWFDSPIAIFINSLAAYLLAHNLIFFVQELFLVVPKALTQSLTPTLYHNNHGWTGDVPIASLFQGTGALAIILTAAIALPLLHRARSSNWCWRVFLFWIVHQGFVQGLVQFPSSVAAPGNDVAQAMRYLNWGPVLQDMVAIAALVTLVAVLIHLSKILGSLSPIALVS